jgi:hypothetical protein
MAAHTDPPRRDWDARAGQTPAALGAARSVQRTPFVPRDLVLRLAQQAVVIKAATRQRAPSELPLPDHGTDHAVGPLTVSGAFEAY